MRVKDVVVRLRACETTAPWEIEALTGAFVQLDVELPDGRWQRVFSGWLYKESPSLNVVEHPVYDVCAQELRDDISGGRRGAGRAGRVQQPVEREEFGRRAGRAGRRTARRDDDGSAPGRRARRRAAAERRRQQRDISRRAAR